MPTRYSQSANMSTVRDLFILLALGVSCSADYVRDSSCCGTCSGIFWWHDFVWSHGYDWCIDDECWGCELLGRCSSDWCDQRGRCSSNGTCSLLACWSDKRLRPCRCTKGKALLIRGLVNGSALFPTSMASEDFYTCCEGDDLHTEVCRNILADMTTLGTWCCTGACACALAAVASIYFSSLLKRCLRVAAPSMMFTVRDGFRLHYHEVPFDHWCVTRKDLQDFRRLVQMAVEERRIKPTDLDPFDPFGQRVGPCIHTVNEQFIKPVTEKAGNASWALMLHPEGLECDLFVTHAWQEGVYEFIDKVLNSWPRGAKHAYCCMLSNPQNLDIATMISNPKESPFAKALERARFMMVVPNSTGSIYKRIWCVYEAFLGYSWDKWIFTASAPIEGLWQQLAIMMFVSLAGAGFAVALLSKDIDDYLKVEEYNVFKMYPHTYGPWLWYIATWLLLLPFVCPILLTTVSSSNRFVSLCRAFRYVITLWFSASFGIIAGFVYCVLTAHQVSNTGNTDMLIWVFYLASLVPPALRAEQMWRDEAKHESFELENGFTGALRDAKASCDNDREVILQELARSGEEENANHAVAVLMKAGISTTALRTVADRIGELQDCRNWSLLLVTFGMGLFLLPSNVITLARDERFSMDGYSIFECSKPWLPWLCRVEGLVWLTFLAVMRSDHRAFAAKTLWLVIASVVSGCVIELCCTYDKFLGGGDCEMPDCCVQGVLAYCVGPLALALSAAGPATCVRIPVVGPLFAHLLLGRGKRRCGCCRRAVFSMRSIVLSQADATMQTVSDPAPSQIPLSQAEATTQAVSDPAPSQIPPQPAQVGRAREE